MNVNFIVNDYVLIWNLLFQASISEDIYKLKQRIWNIYKNEYNQLFKDKELITADYKNFIPNDDTIYNIVIGNKDYEKLKKQADKTRIDIMRVWDKNKKVTEQLFDKIIRLKIPKCNIFVINKEFNVIDYPINNCMIIGKEINKDNQLEVLLDINRVFISRNIKKYNEKNDSFKKVIIELAINEYATRLFKRSFYKYGQKSLRSLKKWLYPYWLMYLGVPKEEFSKYIERDKISFEVDKYAYEKELRKVNIEEFIDFCIRNQRYIVREVKKDNKQVEVL